MLSSWALIGSYKNESYLTDNYLLSFQLTNLNISALIKEVAQQQKRNIFPVEVPISVLSTPLKAILVPSTTAKPDSHEPAKRANDGDFASVTSMLASLATLMPSQVSNEAFALAALTSGSAATNIASVIDSLEPSKIISEVGQLASQVSLIPALENLAQGFIGNAEDLLQEIARNTNASGLGLHDMYQIGFWGYCIGNIKGTRQEVIDMGKFGKQFSNNMVDYTYCTPPKAGYKFDPLQVMKTGLNTEILNLKNEIGSGPLKPVADELVSQLLLLVNLLTYEVIDLPGNLESSLALLGNLTVAGFSLIMAGAGLAFISLICQVVGMCCSPDNSCLSCLNFFLMLLTFFVVLLGSAFTTGVYIFVRKKLNDEFEKYGVRPYLSTQFYAFSWSAVAAALLFVILCAFGYCCGCFKRDRAPKEPEIRYEHRY